MAAEEGSKCGRGSRYEGAGIVIPATLPTQLATLVRILRTKRTATPAATVYQRHRGSIVKDIGRLER